MSQPTSAAPKGPEDADSCRICRGDDAPLFHPCRCSGSIMYVHQDCLMEWLSHSQKKHCELCKTPFRFTKLYHPHMPERLPIATFLQRASLHVVDAVLTWLRGIVVACTWLIWLPWSMRFVWWGLLWIADGGWVGETLEVPELRAHLNESSAPPFVSGFLSRLHGLSDAMPGSTPLGALFNGYMTAHNRSAVYLELQRNNVTVDAFSLHRDTMLSGVSLLNNLTASPALNSFTIDVLEGQIIMFSILTAVVLVFLIREWVVQQQPVMNMAALDEDGAQANGLEPAPGGDQVDHVDPEQVIDNEFDEVAIDAHQPEDATAGDDAELELQADAEHQEETRRPAMPSRDESFLANDVMRSLAQTDSEDYGRPGYHDIGPEHANESPSASNAQADSVARYEETQSAAGASSARLEAQRESSDDFSVIEAESSLRVSTEINQDASDQAEDTAEAQDLERESSAPSNVGMEAPKTWTEQLCDWLWGDQIPHLPVEPQEEMHVVQDVAAEEPFVAVGEALANNQALQQQLQQGQPDQEAAQAFAQAGVNMNDAEAAEELEDLEGLLELIGMQGNLFGLFQNAIFMAVVGAAAITTGVWFPYLWGKVMLLFVAHPLQVLVQLPLQIISTMANFAVDLCIWVVGSVVLWLVSVVNALFLIGALALPSLHDRIPNFIGRHADEITKQSLSRMLRVVMGRPDNTMSDYMHLSASAHASLRKLQAGFQLVSGILVKIITTLYNASGSQDVVQISLKDVAFTSLDYLKKIGSHLVQQAYSVPTLAANLSWVDTFNIKISTPGSLAPLDPSLAIWNGTDRLLAVLAGYVFFAIVGTVYVTHLAPFATTQQAKKIEEGIVDVLQQAGGIMKVIVIISIEMLLFPLYCGALLDVATLPLFGQTTFHDRVMFAINSPWISAFLHWFAGTCYMFHFALFVSMCRKIFRPGVLYFIRDPDDPTFHPVRDVLERNLISQLRKIAFSALIYGGLVIFCMGSVVWAIALFDTGILPVRWSSSLSVSGFPLDLVLYTSLRPVVVKLWSPSNGVHALYKWWFEKCAAQLNLRHFLLNADGDLDQKDTKTTGRFVRVPGSDQARIPRGHPVFLEVNAENERLDDAADNDAGVHGKKNPNFKLVYVPRNFRLRVIAFIVCLWALSAMIGLTLTLVPLVLGRSAFRMFLPSDTHVNDAYAFAVGIIPLALAIYSDVWMRDVSGQFKLLFPNSPSAAAIKQKLMDLSSRAGAICFTYLALGVVVPCLLSLLVELYFIGPFHAYLAGGRELRVIHMFQGWTLGIQYVRIAVSIVGRYPDSRLARAMRALVENGWLKPDVRLATRGFILPLCALSTAAALVPLPIGYLVSLILYSSTEAEQRAQTVRYTYPAVFAIGTAVWLGFASVRALGRWRLRIRDEVYLIGERLHNFGEKQPPSFSKHTATRITQT